MVLIKLMRGLVRTVLFFVGSLKITGQENILPEGPYIIAVNHMSKADPPLLLIVWPPIKMRFFAAEKWEKHLIFGPLMRAGGAIYINRGEVDRKALKEALNALEGGSMFGLAPEGTRSKEDGLIQARDGAAYMATRAKIPVVPVGLANTNTLGDNMLHLRRTKLEVRIGEKIEMPDLGRRPKSTDLAAYTHLIMVHIAALLPEKHWGYYADSTALAALLAGENPWPYCLEEEGVPGAD